MQSFAKRGRLLALSVFSALVVHLITTRAAYFINIAKVTMDRRRGVLQLNNFISQQKLRQALKSWSNFSLVWFAKWREIHRNIARIAKAASYKLPGKSSLNVSFVCPVRPVRPVNFM